MKQRNVSIDILKFFAALIITNSHMELLYGDYKRKHQKFNRSCVIATMFFSLTETCYL